MESRNFSPCSCPAPPHGGGRDGVIVRPTVLPTALSVRLIVFVAWRDLGFARGRFALIASVVLLITLLVGFLGGLTQGLANANISAMVPFQADKVVLSEP